MRLQFLLTLPVSSPRSWPTEMTPEAATTNANVCSLTSDTPPFITNRRVYCMDGEIGTDSNAQLVTDDFKIKGAAIRHTSKDKSRDVAPETCTICLESITERAVAAPCNHLTFDFLCLLSWLQLALAAQPGPVHFPAALDSTRFAASTACTSPRRIFDFDIPAALALCVDARSLRSQPLPQQSHDFCVQSLVFGAVAIPTWSRPSCSTGRLCERKDLGRSFASRYALSSLLQSLQPRQ